MNRIEKKFKELKRSGKQAFIVFITAGYPNLDITKKLILEFDKIGVDIIELGIPFSDPMADGPIIQESSQIALQNKVNLNHILNLVKESRRRTDIPIILMTYYNPIFCFGDQRFMQRALRAGVDGVVVADLPPEEGLSLIKLANKYKLDVICFISPTTPRERISYIANISKGFIYYVSLTGVTGPRQNLPSQLIDNLKEIRKITQKPVCVGFGISSPKHVKQIYKVASGVIVGSAIIGKIKEDINQPDLIKRVSKYVSYLKDV